MIYCDQFEPNSTCVPDTRSSSFYGNRPLIGIINYEGLYGSFKVWDELSLTPPKWNYRLPWYASSVNDRSRLIRTSNTVQDFIYNVSNDVTSVIVYAAFNDSESVNLASDIKIYYSSDNVTYTQYVYDTYNAREINYTTDWKKISYFCNRFQSGIRYIKIAICKTDSSITNPQLMRTEIYYKASNTVGFSDLVDDYNDYTKMYSYTSGLSFATDNPSNYRLVTADDNTQTKMDQQISYANSAHIDYFAWIDTPEIDGHSVVDLFRNSTNRGNLQYCIIVHLDNSSEPMSGARGDRYANYFKDSSYVKVLGDRPLIYLYGPDLWKQSDINTLRNKAITAGCGNPYVVGCSSTDYSFICDSGGTYGISASPGVYQQYAGTTQTIPLVSFGGNDEPRQDNPVPWGNWGVNSPEISGTQLQPYVNQGIQWCINNPLANEANTMLIYAWNEHAEASACIEPTLNSDGSANTTNLDAVGAAIKSWESNLLTNMEFE